MNRKEVYNLGSFCPSFVSVVLVNWSCNVCKDSFAPWPIRHGCRWHHVNTLTQSKKCYLWQRVGEWVLWKKSTSQSPDRLERDSSLGHSSHGHSSTSCLSPLRFSCPSRLLAVSQVCLNSQRHTSLAPTRQSSWLFSLIKYLSGSLELYGYRVPWIWQMPSVYQKVDPKPPSSTWGQQKISRLGQTKLSGK